jgi:hypothetical protein
MEHIKILTRVAEMERERYSSSGDYSVTDIISPPRLVRLRKRYGSEVEQPLSSVIAAMLGTAVHEYFEKYLKKWVFMKTGYAGYTFEEQLQVEMLGRNVSGRYDIRDDLDLIDLKTCKVWKKVFDPELIEWTEQQNCYNYLLKEARNIELKRLLITAIYKDWQEGQSLRSSTYPQDQVEEYELVKWPYEVTKEFMETKLAAHIAAEELPDEELPACTREERWERFNGGHQVEYAIMKSSKSNRAMKLIKTNLDDALSAAKSMKGITKESFIEVRYAQRTRCEKWCSVNEYCNDYKSYASQKKNNTLNDYIPLGV